METHNDLIWKASFDRRLVSTRGGKRHLLIDLQAPNVVSEYSPKRTPLNLALVIDASGSMQGDPLEAARQASIGIVEALHDEDHITVVSFASDVITHADAVLADAQGKRTVIAALEKLHTRGMTNLSSGWLRGCECVAQQMERAPGTQNRAIVISDGHANEGIVDPEQLGLHAAELRGRGLYSSAVGVGDHYNPTQLQAIAEHGSGRLHDAADGQDLVEVVLGELGEILTTAAEDINLTISHPTHLPVKVLGTYPVQAERGQTTVSLGTLVAGAQRQLVVQVDIAPGVVGDRLLIELTPTWKVPGENHTVTKPAIIAEIVLAPVEEVAAELPNLEICGAIAAMWQKDIMFKATTMNSEGRYEDAQRFLDEVLPEFRAYVRDLPGGRDMMRQLRRYQRVVTQPMAARGLRDNYVACRKGMIMEEDLRHRLRDPNPWDEPR